MRLLDSIKWLKLRTQFGMRDDLIATPMKTFFVWIVNKLFFVCVYIRLFENPQPASSEIVQAVDSLHSSRRTAEIQKSPCINH